MLMIIVRFTGCLLSGRAEIKTVRTLFEPAPVMTALTAGALMWLYDAGVLHELSRGPQLNIQPATLSAIKERYPDDLAIDFVEGELRGSWHLIFDQEK